MNCSRPAPALHVLQRETQIFQPTSIEDVLDVDLFNEELTAEETDSTQIIAVRRQVETFLQSLGIT
jgi:hypothetical protein